MPIIRYIRGFFLKKSYIILRIPDLINREGSVTMNLNGCRECEHYIIDNMSQIICSFNGKINYHDIFAGRRRSSLILSCPRKKSIVLG